MSSRANPETSTLAGVQRELILAQITLQELEDTREELLTRVAEADEIRSAAQATADRALADFDHLHAVHRELLAHRDHLQHVQHVTQQALEATRAELAQREATLAERDRALAAARDHVTQLDQHVAQLRETIANLETQLNTATATAAAHAARIQQLDLELRTMKASRSWRWTAWLRSLERLVRRPAR